MNITRYKLVCPKCGQEGVLVEKESYELPDAGATGDCSDDMTVYYYSFEVENGDFSVIHNDPHSFSHRTLCAKCRVEAKEERL